MNDSTDRRRHLRQPLHLSVWVIAPDRRAYAGTAKNFSLGGRGLFVGCRSLSSEEADPTARPLTAGDAVELCFSIPVCRVVRNVRLDARVISRFGSSLGVELTDPGVEVLVALQDMANRTRTLGHTGDATGKEGSQR
jgi:hypothetical protein